MAVLHFAYAALKLKSYKLFNSYIDSAVFTADNDADKDYLKAVKQWTLFENNGTDKETALAIMKKFFFADTVNQRRQRDEDHCVSKHFHSRHHDHPLCRVVTNR